MHIPLIMEIIDNIVSPDDRRGKYSDKQILKILILLWIFGISHRSSGIFLRNHKECIELIRIKIYHHFRLSQEGQYASISMVNTCKYFTADRKRNYKYPLSGWFKTAKGWSYGGSAICPLILIPF